MLSTNQDDQWKMLKEQLTNDDFVTLCRMRMDNATIKPSEALESLAKGFMSISTFIAEVNIFKMMQKNNESINDYFNRLMNIVNTTSWDTSEAEKQIMKILEVNTMHADKLPSSQKSVKCFNCQEYGHISRNYSRDIKPVMNRRIIENNNEHTHELKIRQNDEDVSLTFIIDTGSQINCLSHESFKKFKNVKIYPIDVS
ncbi:hypothetical protein A3Q56_01357 [Intoshia linei]|uniref:CCHC-type domain-containing protein n=1 Tax=Intoshia linei TaxID=1819745 RepID=A0A177B9H6_9BILA|nr:hypothetical protein A3Q56_01357 [Intoshia linei]